MYLKKDEGRLIDTFANATYSAIHYEREYCGDYHIMDQVPQIKERLLKANLNRYSYETAIMQVANDIGNLLESNGHHRTDKNFAPKWIYKYSQALESILPGKNAYGVYHDIFCIMMEFEYKN